MKVKEIPIKELKRVSNIRDEKDESLKSLADTFEQYGMLQPVIVTPDNGKYRIICGHRRVAAAKIAREETVTCSVVTDLTDEDIPYIQLIENTSRKQMTPWEIVPLLDKMKKTMSVKQIAKKIGQSEQWIYNQYYALHELDSMYGGNIDEKAKKLTCGEILSRSKALHTATYKKNGIRINITPQKLVVFCEDKNKAKEVFKKIMDLLEITENDRC